MTEVHNIIGLYYVQYMWQGSLGVSDMTAYIVGGQKMNKCG